MSSKEITEVFKNILENDWEDEEIVLFNRLLEGYMFSRRFITKVMKQDFLEFLILFEKMKKDLNKQKDSI